MADPFEDEVEHTVSIQEYLQNVEEEELEADLVLGGDEGKECTYANGYMKRQAVFSCVTCNPDGNAGVCTACSLSCHDGHEIVELWTKRNFRCDCGNSKFGEFYCKLFANKDPENSENSYNQNFKGLYCTCGRPYPDPDAEDQVEMIQCCICEDWLHETHLGLESLDEIPRDEEGEPLYEDFICQACAKICSFLTLYPPAIWAPVRQSDAPQNSDKEENASAGTMKLENGTASLNTPKIESVAAETTSDIVKDSKVSSEEKSEITMDSREKTEATVPSPKCILGVDLGISPLTLEKTKPMFLSKNWRGRLCKCESCVKFYSQKGISFLIDGEDSIAEYENMAKQKRQEKQQLQEGAELNFLNKLGHVQKVEILSGIADMKNELLSYLGSVDSSKPVTTADVQQVFENLAKKRQRQLTKRAFKDMNGKRTENEEHRKKRHSNPSRNEESGASQSSRDLGAVSRDLSPSQSRKGPKSNTTLSRSFHTLIESRKNRSPQAKRDQHVNRGRSPNLTLPPRRGYSFTGAGEISLHAGVLYFGPETSFKTPNLSQTSPKLHQTLPLPLGHPNPCKLGV